MFDGHRWRYCLTNNVYVYFHFTDSCTCSYEWKSINWNTKSDWHLFLHSNHNQLVHSKWYSNFSIHHLTHRKFLFPSGKQHYLITMKIKLHMCLHKTGLQLSVIERAKDWRWLGKYPSSDWHIVDQLPPRHLSTQFRAPPDSATITNGAMGTILIPCFSDSLNHIMRLWFPKKWPFGRPRSPPGKGEVRWANPNMSTHLIAKSRATTSSGRKTVENGVTIVTAMWAEAMNGKMDTSLRNRSGINGRYHNGEPWVRHEENENKKPYPNKRRTEHWPNKV